MDRCWILTLHSVTIGCQKVAVFPHWNHKPLEGPSIWLFRTHIGRAGMWLQVKKKRKKKKKKDATYLWVVLHHPADLRHYVNATLPVQSVDQLWQVGFAVPDGPVLQGGISTLVVGRVAVWKGCQLSLRGVGQQLVEVDPLGAHLSRHQLEDVHTCQEENSGEPKSLILHLWMFQCIQWCFVLEIDGRKEGTWSRY